MTAPLDLDRLDEMAAAANQELVIDYVRDGWIHMSPYTVKQLTAEIRALRERLAKEYETAIKAIDALAAAEVREERLREALRNVRINLFHHSMFTDEWVLGHNDVIDAALSADGGKE